MYLQIIRTNSTEYQQFPHDTGTIYICLDNLKIFLDNNKHYRMEITKNSVLCNTIDEFNNLGSYIINKLYIVMDTNEFYIFTKDEDDINNGNTIKQRVYLYKEIVNKVIEDPSTLKPKLLMQNGYPIAPRTSTSAIFNRNGEQVTDAIEEMRNDVRHYNKTWERSVQCKTQGQTIFTLPTPVEDYDINTCNLYVSIDNGYISPDNYDINDTKIIFKTGVDYDSVIKFIFHYHVVKNLNEVLPGSVGINSLDVNLKKIIESSKDINDIIFPNGDSLYEKIKLILEKLQGTDDTDGIEKAVTDIIELIRILDTKLTQKIDESKNVLDSNETKLNDVKNNIDLILDKLNNQNTEVTSIKRIQRGVAQMDKNSEAKEIMFDHPIIVEKTLITLEGDSYYNESPYIYEVHEDRFIVRQKTPVVNDDYRSWFSWQAVEYL